MLNNIKITPLDRVEILGGDVLHAMKSSDFGYAGFGEAYFSCINYGSIKAWKRHRRMVMNLVVPVGRVKFVFHIPENQVSNSFHVLEIGKDNYSRITVPPGIWFGFQGLEKSQSLVLNISDITHDPSEVERKTINEIVYDWNLIK